MEGERLCALSKMRGEGLLTEDEFYSAVQMMADDFLAPLDEHKGGGKNCSGGIQLYVAPTVDIGGTFPVELSFDATVGDLKKDILAHTGITNDRQAISFGGDTLSPEMDDLMLADVGICPETTLDLRFNHRVTWNGDEAPEELEITPFVVQSCGQRKAPRDQMKYAASTQLLEGKVHWEMEVRGCPRAGGERAGAGRLRPRSADADDQEATMYVGIADAQLDTERPSTDKLVGSVTWGNNGEVTMHFQNSRGQQAVMDVIKSSRLQFGSGALVGFSFDADKRSLNFYKNGERVHFIGPTALFLDNYRAVCSPGGSAGVENNPNISFEA